MRPWIDWANWRTVHRWGLARGCPPVLRDERPRVRAFRIALLCGAQGATAAMLAGITGAVLEAFPISAYPDVGLFFPPAAFALVALVPLSRWLGRGWILTGLSLPVSIAAYWGGIWMFFWGATLIKQSPGTFLGGLNGTLGGLIGGLSSGLILGIWMSHPGRRLPLGQVLLTGAAGMLGGLGFSLLASNHVEPWGANWFRPLVALAYGQAHMPYQILVAIALGMRLLPEAVPIHNGELADSGSQ